MRGYQYYEFLAIDRPLTADELDELWAISPRATITPVSFTKKYTRGDFKGDPDKLMQRYFDAHVYVANWMRAIFMVRLPMEALTRETAKAAAVPYLLDIEPTRTHWIITWSLGESENYERFDVEDGLGWMELLAPVRDELLCGDLRSLYIGWLAAAGGETMDDDEMEPICVSGLGDLTASQQALAQFLEVDPYLLAGAGMGSPSAPKAEILLQEMDMWVDALPGEEVHSILKQLLEGKGQQAERSIRNRFAAWRRGFQNNATDASRRTVGELRQNAVKARLIQLEKRKRDHEQREIERRKEHEEYLKTLADDFSKAWASVREPVERGSGWGYDIACRIIVDIAEAYDLFATKEQFQDELKRFMTDYLRRRALIRRLVKAGIWKDQ